MPADASNSLYKAALVQRRHPDYAEMLDHWNFVEATYQGGRAWFRSNVFRYLKEGDREYADRVERAYRFNHTREVVDLVTKYVFKGEIVRADDAPERIKAFWRHATRKGDGIDTLMREISRMMSVYGRPYIFVDSTFRPTVEGAVTRADEADGRIYAYAVKPQNVLDMSYDEHGAFNWVLVYETDRDDADFFNASFLEEEHFRLWTRDEWYLFRMLAPDQSQPGATRRDPEIELIGQGRHDLGVVPVIAPSDRESDDDYKAPGLIDDIAYLDRAVANYLSNLDAIIQDQTFSQLTIPAQSVLPGEENYDKLIEMGTKRIFLYDGEGGKGPEFISPDASQAHVILAVVTKIITEIYHTVGMAGERTKMDNAAGIDNSSGVAKAYDFDRMNTMLKAKADRLRDVENALCRLVLMWAGETLAEDDDSFVTYPEEFDTRGLYDEFDIANRLALIQAPGAIRRHQLERTIEKLFPQLSTDLKAQIRAELKEWPADPAEAEGLDGSPQLDRSKPAAENRQGQVTKDTD